MSFLFFKKSTVAILMASQVVLPLSSYAATNHVRVAVPGLMVDFGSPLPTKEYEQGNTTASEERAGSAILRIAPSEQHLGTVQVDQLSPIRTLGLTNIGGGALTLGSLSLEGSQFTVTDNCDGVLLPPLAKCEINLQFAPTEAPTSLVRSRLSVPFSSEGSSAIGYARLSGDVAAAPEGLE